MLSTKNPLKYSFKYYSLVFIILRTLNLSHDYVRMCLQVKVLYKIFNFITLSKTELLFQLFDHIVQTE